MNMLCRFQHAKYISYYIIIILVLLTTTSISHSTPYTPAIEDPIVDGYFSSTKEYIQANKVLDDLSVGYFYKEHRSNWTVSGTKYSNTITFFNTHQFYDPGYGQLDQYDLNMFDYKWGDTQVTTWVFLPGDHPDTVDHYWLNIVGLGNYSSLNDDGGFLVRLNNDPSTDKQWKPGDAKPGDPGWDFADYYGVFAYGGFNDSAHSKGYSSVVEPREIYEWSITMNTIGIGIPGGGNGGGNGESNPPAPGICSPIWEHYTKLSQVKDPTTAMQGYGTLGGYIPNSSDWALMGSENSMHPVPTPEPSTYLLISFGLCFVYVKTKMTTHKQRDVSHRDTLSNNLHHHTIK